MIFYRKIKSPNLPKFLLASTILFLVTACEQANEKNAAAFAPKTVGKINAAVNQKLAQPKFKDARIEGAGFPDGKQDTSGHLAWALAKASSRFHEEDAALSIEFVLPIRAI
ncbi:MAG: hypothetical protein JWQ23_1462 [Herminiimonas sp.]|nr:hypothetical protein [Herminiimonas sp.]